MELMLTKLMEAVPVAGSTMHTPAFPMGIIDGQQRRLDEDQHIVHSTGQADKLGVGSNKEKSRTRCSKFPHSCFLVCVIRTAVALILPSYLPSSLVLPK